MKQRILIFLVLLGTLYAQQRAISLSRNVISYKKYDQEFTRFRAIGLSMRWNHDYMKSETTWDTTLVTTTSGVRGFAFSVLFSTARQAFEAVDKREKWFFYFTYALKISPNYRLSDRNYRTRRPYEETEQKERLYGVNLSLSTSLQVDYHVTERIFLFSGIGIFSVTGSITKKSTDSENSWNGTDWQYRLGGRIVGSRLNFLSVGLIYCF